MTLTKKPILPILLSFITIIFVLPLFIIFVVYCYNGVMYSKQLESPRIDAYITCIQNISRNKEDTNNQKSIDENLKCRNL